MTQLQSQINASKARIDQYKNSELFSGQKRERLIALAERELEVLTAQQPKNDTMPTLNKTYSLTITPEQFLENCSDVELQELELLLSSARFQVKIKKPEAITQDAAVSFHRTAESVLRFAEAATRNFNHNDSCHDKTK